LKRDLAQLVFFAAWFVLLLKYRPLRDLVRAAPRSLTIAVGTLVLLWLVVQVTDQRSRFYPLVSVYMYGEHNPAPELSAVAMTGRRCGGGSERLDLDFMGRGRIRSRLQVLYGGLARRKTAADSAARWDLIDRLVISVGRMHNRAFPDRALCAIGIEEIRIPAAQYTTGVLPPPVTVHEISLR
jgi:hypothetical protein